MANIHTPAVSASPFPSGPDASSSSDLSPACQAGLLLSATQVARDVGIESTPTETIIEATGAGRTRAYEMRGRVLDQLSAMQRPPGRPSAPPEPPIEAELRAEICSQMLRYVRSHPGSISATSCSNSASTTSTSPSATSPKPSRSLPPPSPTGSAPPPPGPEPSPAPTGNNGDSGDNGDNGDNGDAGNDGNEGEPTRSGDAIIARTETVIGEWKHWSGIFSDFSDHIRHHFHIDWGRTTIAGILFQHGLRTPKRRPGRSPDEKALRDQFETFFPGAQWVGDGATIPVWFAGDCFAFNLELTIDTDSGAFVGFDVTDEEDSAAVTSAFADGVRTTTEPPIAFLLDNRPSNHTPEVYEALGSTLLIRSTRSRAQNKAHVEGAFGLFQQQAPPLVLHNHQPRQIARQLLILICQTWARTLNHRPRSDRDGLSRIQLYSAADPTPEQISQAQEALRERLRKQQLADRTRKARLDPTVRRSLDDAFPRLGLSDPTGNIRDAIAAYPHDPVIEAISIFEGKQNAHTLPPDADARYLLGIARNLTQEREGSEIAEALWRERLRARDHALSYLDSQRQHLEHDLPSDDPFPLLKTLVDHALATDRRLDRFFWLQAAVDAAIHTPTSPPLEPLFRTAARRIFATHRVPYTDRLAAVRFLAAKLLPLDHLHPKN